MKRLLLLMGTETYRATDFLAAARKLGIEVVTGLDKPDPLAELHSGGILSLDFMDLEGATEKIVRFHEGAPLAAVVSVDDSATVLAARAGKALGLFANSEESTIATLNKFVFREIMRAEGMRSPWFERFPVHGDAERFAGEVPYPCVLKPLFLNASRGVIRADHPGEFTAAFHRIGRLLGDEELRKKGGESAQWILVESFMPGKEIALEGMMKEGEFQLLAFFDKPDPLDGPFFEETIFVTPSRFPEESQKASIRVAAAGARAMGLRTGPVHAELRLDGGEPYLLEIAARSIGGHCSRALRFVGEMSAEDRSLEELILRQALREASATGDRETMLRETGASGVMMIPIPGRGRLKAVRGVEDARRVAGITEVEISIPITQEVIPLPEGRRYLGFIFAKGDSPAWVESALREAHEKLGFELEGGDGAHQIADAPTGTSKRM